MTLNQITLPATDVAASAAFYRRIGCRQIVDTPHYARFEAPAGDATLSVHAVGAVPARTGVVTYFEFPSADALDERVRELGAAGVRFDTAPTDERWLWREARLRDPAGNVLCLYHAGPNRLFPPWRVEEQDASGGPRP